MSAKLCPSGHPMCGAVACTALPCHATLRCLYALLCRCRAMPCWAVPCRAVPCYGRVTQLANCCHFFSACRCFTTAPACHSYLVSLWLVCCSNTSPPTSCGLVGCTCCRAGAYPKEAWHRHCCA